MGLLELMAFQSISNYGKSLALRLAGEKHAAFIRLYMDYKAVVGDILAQRSHPFRYKNEVLFIAVENNSWLQELVLHKATIISKYQSVSGIKPKDILFFIRPKQEQP